jgi:LuxR family transcriptional regulator, activator of conjugal transfer of Ti plasmids
MASWAVLPEADTPLSRREKQVLAIAANGYRIPETATLLGISTHMVRLHLAMARQRLAASTTAEAVARAIREGLL